MATIIKFHDPDPDVEAQNFLLHLDDKFLACHGQGHNFPRIKRTRSGKQPRGIRAIRQHDGSYQLVFICPECGTERELVTLPGGQIDLPARYRYKYPDGYRAPKGAKLTRRDYFAESWRRLLEDLSAETERESAGAAEVKFSNA